jgi:glycosyltransferase involved in cell wall biosynthesis
MHSQKKITPQKPQTILVISREFYPFTFGGLAKLMWQYLTRAEQFDFDVLTWKHSNREDEERMRFLQLPFPGMIKEMRYVKGTWFYVIGFLSVIFRSRCSAMVGVAFNGALLCAVLKVFKRVPIMSIIYDVDQLKPHSKDFHPLMKTIRRLVFKYILKYSDRIMCGSEKSMQDIAETFAISTDKIIVNPPGRDIPENDGFKREHDNVDYFKLLTVGSVTPKVGYEFIIRAVRILLDRGFPVKLTIVGTEVSKEYGEMLRDLSERLALQKAVIFTGRVDDVWSYHWNCDVLVIASYYQQGFSMPVIEASSLGKPVVVTNYLAGSGVIVPDVTGISVEEKNPEAIANAIQRLISDNELRVKMGKAGKEFVNRFDWNLSARNFELSIQGMV